MGIGVDDPCFFRTSVGVCPALTLIPSLRRTGVLVVAPENVAFLFDVRVLPEWLGMDLCSSLRFGTPP
jgi:hypothetical protein